MRGPRSYHQTARAETAAQTARTVLEAASRLLMERWYDDVTLEDIASAAGVSSKTVQRQFGSKDGVAREVFLALGRENSAWRDTIPTGDLDGAMHAIVSMYEGMGDAIIRYLSLESRSETVAELLAGGRQLHRGWVERVFAPMLPAPATARREAISLLVVATDVYTWKLLRRDAGLSRAATTQAMQKLARSAVHSHEEK